MVSVIIPIYNAEKKLHRMLSSIEKQSYSDFELLLINDGSQDNTEIICKVAMEKDRRIHYYYQENAGVSSARNYGLQKAQGEYIAFLDADDEIEQNYFEELLNASTDVDIIVCDVIGETEEGKQLFQFSLDNQILTQIEALNYLLTRKGINSGPCAKLFKREIVEKLEFPSLRAYEDILFVVEAFCNARKIAVINSTAYHYIQNQDSTMNNFVKIPSFDIIVATERIMRILLENKALNTDCQYITLSHLYQYVIPLISKSEWHISFISEVQRLFRKYYRYIFMNKSFSWKEKIIYMLFCLGWTYNDKEIKRIRR